MKKNNFPNKIPIFPLSNAIFFPRTTLPLNIFEDRYIQLVNDCMKNNRMFGMVQPKNRGNTKQEVYGIGCLGKIVSFQETEDRRFIISLSGMIRFRINKESNKEKLYRTFEVDYSEFLTDLDKKQDQKINYNKNSLLNNIKAYFRKINYPINFDELEKLNLDLLASTVAMISPFSVEEKQKIVEAVKIEDKIKTLDEIINFNLLDFQENKTIQ
ncbi:MAG: ATP-dependent protease [Candidatus Pelagibacterales bacterium]|nr:MAG: ATP-dependent protease [Pelagibacterales bacterium]